MRFAHDGRFLSGLAVPLSALRTKASSGCGEYPDLVAAGELASSLGLELIQLLPVNDSGTQTSPYSALSAFALHPLYLRIGALPELATPAAASLRPEAEALVSAFAPSPRMRHYDLLSAKLELLRKLWATKKKRSSDAELDAWIAANAWVRDYGAFVELKRRNTGAPWWEWSAFRNPTSEDVAGLWLDAAWLDDLRFWAWLQLRAEGQFRAAAESLAAKGIALMGDIPILMNQDSAEVWARRNCFKLELKAGAPPDMYAEFGQNWGFPIYDWEALAASDYGFWVDRLRETDKYYSCYRIDHVLGFFRIWSLGERERTGYLGRFVPDLDIARSELEGLGFHADRIRWMSEPHIQTSRLVAAAGEAAARGAMHVALDRIGQEELFLFRRSIRGEMDIEALPGLSPAALNFLLSAWRDRALFEYESGRYVPSWRHDSTSSWASLSGQERETLESLFRRKEEDSERLWAETGRRLLGELKKAVPMLPCAEDLGAVPDCVPAVLEELGILGLRVLRWTREWEEEGQPYTPTKDYPRLSVACPSVHDSTSLREWWEVEADRASTWAFIARSLGRELGPCPEELAPGAEFLVLEALSSSNSLFVVYPIQDLIALSEKHRPADAKSERINVPGTMNDENWSYRMPVGIEELRKDAGLAKIVRNLAAARPKQAPLPGKGRTGAGKRTKVKE